MVWLLFNMNQIEIHRINGIQVVCAGQEGPNIIFLHPAGQPPLGMREHIAQLAPYGRVVAPNLYDLVAACIRNGIKKPTFDDLSHEFSRLEITSQDARTGLVAASFGGSFAWRYAAEHHQEIDWVVAGSPTGWPLRRSLGWMIEFIRMMHNFSQAPAELRKRDAGSGLFIKQAIVTPRAVFQGLVMAANANDKEVLGAVAAPVELLWGRKDTFIPAEGGRRMQLLLRSASFKEVSEYGHLWFCLEPEKLTTPAIAHLGLSR